MAKSALLAFAAACCVLALTVAPVAQADNWPGKLWQPEKLQGVGKNVRIKILDSNAFYVDTLVVYDMNGQVIKTVGTNRDTGNVVDIGVIGKGVEFYLGINTNVGTSYFSKQALNTDKQAQHLNCDITADDPITGFTFRCGFEDRAKKEDDRPEAPDAKKDFNDFMFKIKNIKYIDTATGVTGEA